MLGAFRFSVGRKIYALIALSSLGLIAVALFTLQGMSASMRSQKQIELTHLAELALGIVKQEYAATQTGALTKEAAQQRAAEQLAALRYGSDDYFWINDMRPRMVMHPTNPALNGKDLTSFKDPNGKALFVEFTEVVKRDGAGFVAYEWPKPGSEKPQPKLSRVVGFAPWGWVIGTGVYIDDLTQQTWDVARNALIVLLVVLAVVGPISMLFARRMSQAVSAITATMMRLAAGDVDFDLGRNTRRDEIGDMAQALEVFKRNAQDNRRLAKEQQDNEARRSEEQRAAIEREAAQQRAAEDRAAGERKLAVHALADGFEQAVGGIVDSVSAASSELEAAANALTATADKAQQLSSVVAAASEEASSNVRSVASATEEMSGSVGDISRYVQESREIASEAVAQAQKTDARISALSQAASRIGDVVKLITAIADQTNLLALNATIEAARAGEAGRGFAVVAQEVKALATQTGKATGEIGAQIASIQESTSESVASIKEIGGTIARIAQISATIASAVDQQGASAQEIARNVQEASRGTDQVAHAITEVRHGARETGSASSQVLASAHSLASESNRLKAEVRKFLQTVRTG